MAGQKGHDPRFARFAGLLAEAQAEAFTTGGKALTDTEKAVVFGYIPTGDEWSAEQFEQKLSLANERLPGYLDQTAIWAGVPKGKVGEAVQAERGRRQRDIEERKKQAPTAPPAPPAAPKSGEGITVDESSMPQGDAPKPDAEGWTTLPSGLRVRVKGGGK